MKYYIWLDADGRPLSKAWPNLDETERMVEEHRPHDHDAVLRAATREQLKSNYGLTDDDFIEG